MLARPYDGGIDATATMISDAGLRGRRQRPVPAQVVTLTGIAAP